MIYRVEVHWSVSKLTNKNSIYLILEEKHTFPVCPIVYCRQNDGPRELHNRSL